MHHSKKGIVQDKTSSLRRSFKGFAWVSLGRVVSGIVGFLTSVTFIHVLEPSQFGIGSLILTIAGFFSTFSDLGISNSIIKTIADAKATNCYSEARKLLVIASVSVSIAGLFLAMILLHFSTQIFNLLKIPEAAQLLQLGCILVVAIPLHNISLSTIASLQNFQLVGMLRLLGSLVRFLSFVGFVYLGVEAMIISFVVSCATVSILGFVFSMKSLSSYKEPENPLQAGWFKSTKKLFIFSRFLFVTNLFKAFHGRVGVFLLGILGDPTLVGYYKAVTELSVPFLSLITSSTTTTLYPILSESHALGDDKQFREVHRTFLKMELILTVPLVFGMIVLMKTFLTVFFWRYLPVLGYFQLLSTRIPILVAKNLYNPITILALRKPEKRMSIMGLLTACYALLALGMIPTLGLGGAVFTDFAISCISLLLSYKAVEGDLLSGLPFSFYSRLLGSSFIMSVPVFFLSRILSESFLSILLCVVLGVTVFIMVFLRIGGIDITEIESLERMFSSVPSIKGFLTVVKKSGIVRK